MDNFVLHNPTKLHFGKNIINELGNCIALYGKKVLLVYGRNSIKENGIYNDVMTQLKMIGAEVYEYSGIRPNPIVEDVDFAARLGRNNNVDVVLAVGGGSVIDSAKIISITIPVSHSAWDFYSGYKKPVSAIPLIAVLTLAATGTEMNPFAVIQNQKSRQKLGWGHPLCFPKDSFLDPQYTFSVPKNYTAYGIADLISHCLEAYFGKGESTLSDRIAVSIIKEAMHYGPLLLNDLKNYEYREKIMYAATLALNGITLTGKPNGDWGVHNAGHILSLLFDTPHGASLTIVCPAWMKLLKERASDKIEALGTELFRKSNPDTVIEGFENFFRSISCPVTLTEAGISEAYKQQIYDTMAYNKVTGSNYRLSEQDLLQLIELMQ
jgi:alcohol dehydrogenase YqhD (iron-dependent ADH family)